MGMTPVQFDVVRRIEAPVRGVWDVLVDWPGHADWIPATTVDPGEGDPAEVGYTFTAWTGFRPLALEDRMRVTRCDFDDTTSTGTCTVDKLGPVLGGSAGFTVRPDGGVTVLEWHEDVTVPYLPRFLAPVAAWFGAIGFKLALRKLGSVVATTSSSRPSPPTP